VTRVASSRTPFFSSRGVCGSPGQATGAGEVQSELMEVGDGSFVVALTGRVAGRYHILLSHGAQLLKGSPFTALLQPGRPSAMTCITLLDGFRFGGPGKVRWCDDVCVSV
jgi:hypothetical protein